ncbi:MAG: 16S rRNA (guanine(966)-N(2))-methyltransferase RsmD [Desulfobulbus propionicus]|nr:MAG: 16S rRNA (guanine(966)-N(2))-methyltransferase RsmD [Desulfobulbus propionicus]
MRLTGGIACGCRLASPGSRAVTRPTSDRVREALFSILASRVTEAKVLDLFAGTGALGLEALSRGAHSAVLVDRSREAHRLMTRNLAHCLKTSRAKILGLDIRKTSFTTELIRSLPPGHCFDLVFIDPPYEKNLATTTLKMVENAHILSPDALVILEERYTLQPPTLSGSTLTLSDHRNYGETGIWFYSKSSSPDDSA